MAYQFPGLREAFSAAVSAAKDKVPSAENNTKEAAAAEEEEDSFSIRLHNHSARLSETVANASTGNDDDHSLLFSSQNNHLQDDAFEPDSVKKGKKTDNDNQITIELSSASVVKLNEIFGYDGLPSDVTEVHLPIWLCEFLFKAIQKETIADSLREEYEQQNDYLTFEYLASLQTPDKSNQKKEKTASLTRLYEVFPGIPHKVISQMAKEMDFDFQRIACSLADHIDDDHPIDPPNSAEEGQHTAKHSLIVPSLCPRVISAEKQQRTKGTEMGTNTEDNHNAKANFLSPLPPESWDMEVQDVEKELRKIDEDLKHCTEMRTKYVGFKNINISGVYSLRAKELGTTKEALTKYWNQLRVWRASSLEYIDLHEMNVKTALFVVAEKINICREKHPDISKLYVITGYGKATGSAMIKPKLIAFLKSKGINAYVLPKNEGVLVINLTKILCPIK